ncbi:MAG: dephospho-CoA kinase [Candidatus Gastranaerophilales bacterium]|nr:dephospho-CoA kinase [Candidatus Gastranaerophilales bacterium]
MIKVGISGKIASGKSEVEKILCRLNYKVFDLDIISHNLFENESIKNALLNEFKTLDRKEIGNVVFNDLEKKEKLENILYPELQKIIFELFEENKNEKYIFISGALLFKSGFYNFFDKTIFVDAPENIRLERLMKRNNLDKNIALERLNLQDDGNFADFIIQNNSDIDNLKKQVLEILELI